MAHTQNTVTALRVFLDEFARTLPLSNFKRTQTHKLSLNETE